jgi:integrase
MTLDLYGHLFDAQLDTVAERMTEARRLGHASVTITIEIYQHVMPGMQAEAAVKFAAIVEGA